MSGVLHEEVTQGDESSAGIASDLVISSQSADEMPPESEKGSDAGHECRSMASGFVHSDVPTPVAENETLQSGIKSTANKEIKKKKLIDSSHGLRFESKLLALFCIRGLGAGYKFELSKEKEDQGGKLEDLIFRYEVPDETPAGKHWRYRYLQAKHKENEKETITADHLLDYNPKGDFNLLKYFHSFYKIRARGDDINDCIICTNIGFNMDSLKRGGIELVSINDQLEDILEFGAQEKKTARYKLKISNEDWHRKLKEEWSPVKLLAEELKDCATKNKTTDIRAGMLNSYHVALVDEHVIDCTTKKFHQDFVSDATNLSEGAKELRQTVCEWGKNDSWKDWKFQLSNNFRRGQSAVTNSLPHKITEEDVDDFFDKLVFVVDMPHEKKFEEIIETRDMSKYYQPDKCKDQTIRILHEVPAKFSNQEQTFWMTSQSAKNILLDGVTKMSLEYQSRLEKEIKFNDSAIQTMVNHLKQKLLNSCGRKKVEWIATPSPQHTAVKVISAVEILMQELEPKGKYLITSSSRKNDAEQMWKNILKLQKGFHHFFVVVCDDESTVHKYANLISDNEADDRNFTIIVGLDTSSAGITDEIKYTDLSDNLQEIILSKTVSFQGENLTVGNLIGDRPEEIIDFSLIQELLLDKKEVKIPSYDTSRFEESLNINRRVRTAFDNHFEDETAKRLNCTAEKLRKECRISLPDGHIEWLVKGERQQQIWDKMITGADKTTPSGIVQKDNQLISFEIKGRSIVIISGVAGTGKSTLLSHFYKEIKRAKPDYWVIKMNLVDQCEAIMKWHANQNNATDFLVHYLHEIGNKDSFTNSLLRHRLETGDRIVIMLDGFDEIDARCQKGAVQLMEAISKNKSIRLYVTTRPHSVDDLQNEFFQFSYTLEIFDRNDQIKYLTEYWEKKIDTKEEIEDKAIIRKFAASLADRVSQTLRDDERSFIGVPLQCRILAECFQPELKTIIKDCKDGLEQTDFENQLFANVNFDLNSLYERLMETKRRVFREEKAKEKASDPNEVIAFAIDFLMKKIESHLTKLAIETLVTDKKSADTLWPPQSSYNQSETEKTQEENNITKFGIKFGLITFKDRDEATKTQFLHRTFAEYLLAKYLYKGLAVDDCENNQLLENEPVRELIISKILVEDNYDGVRMFIDAMLKEMVHSEKWSLVINKKVELPLRLQNFACSLAQHIRKKEVLPSPPSFDPNPISLALQRDNRNLFYTLLRCLERKFDQTEMNAIVRSALDKNCFSFQYFLYFGSAEFFRSIMIYYDDADYAEVQRTIKEILYEPMITLFTLESYRLIWESEQRKEIVKIVLVIMKKRQTILQPMWDSESNSLERLHFSVALLHFFVFNEYYGSLLKRFFSLLSSVYSNDSTFLNLLNRTLRMRDANNNNWAYPLNSGIEKTLTNLRHLKRHKVMEGLSQLALVWDKKVFETFYQPCRPTNDEDYSESQLLLERVSSRMTRFHRAAFNDDAPTVNDILETIRTDFSLGQHLDILKLLLVESAVVADTMLDRYDKSFTPFYVAAACHHKEICVKILSFSKEILGADHKEDLTEYGFVYSAMWDAILFKNLQMFQVILEAVKEAWGRNSLLVLLKTDNSEISSYDNSHFYVSSSLTEKFNQDLLKTKVKVLLQNDREQDYQDLNNLVLTSTDRGKIRKTLEDLEDETLQGMLIVKGLENWTKPFFDLGIDWAFRFLSRNLLARFTRNQRSQFVDAITSPHTPIIRFKRAIEISYWAEWLVGEKFTDEDFDCLDKLLKLIAENENNKTTDIQKLLFNDNGKDLTRALMCGNQKIISIVSKHLSRINQLRIMKYFRENGPEIIKEFFQFDDTILKRQVFRYWVNILPFYRSRKGKQQFGQLVKTLLLLRTEKHGKVKVQYSFWSKYLDHYDEDGNKVEMVDQFLKFVSEKLGKGALRKVVLHKDCMGIVLLGAELQENKQLVNVMLTHLSDQDRDCVNLLISTNCPFNSRRYKSTRSVEPCQCIPMNSCWCWRCWCWRC